MFMGVCGPSGLGEDRKQKISELDTLLRDPLHIKPPPPPLI